MTGSAAPTPPTQPATDYGKKWWVLLAVGLSLFLGSVDGSIVNVAVAPLMESLHADFPTVQWVILSYLLGLALLLVGMGRLADMVGKKRIFVTGIVLFLVGSALCGLSPNVYWLIGFRVVQSVGAAMIIALGTAILTETWPASQRGTVLGFAAGFISLGIVLGPVAGGLILDALSWRWIFYVNVPVGAISLLIVMFFLPPLPPQNRRERFDFAGAAVMGVGLLAFTLAMTVGQNIGFTDPLIVVLLSISGIMLPVFVWLERRVAFPIMDLSLFKAPAFSLNLFTATLAFIAIAGVVLLLPIYLNLVLGLDMARRHPDGGGALIMVAIQPLSGTLSDHFGTRRVSLIGLFFIFGGYLLMTTLQTDSSQIGFVLRMLPVATGMATFNSPNNSAIMGSVPRTRLGVASGILSMVRTLGQVTGIAALGAFFASRVAHYGGGAELNTAPPESLVLALHDQFYLVAALIFIGIIVSMLTWRWEVRTQRARTQAAQPAGVVVTHNHGEVNR